VIAPELCPDDGLQSQLPEHVTVAVPLPSEVKSTCKYPVDDVYALLELTEPDSRAICSVELHDDDVQRLMVT
jgi:hypothetical protein